jgi:hypothetical protein
MSDMGARRSRADVGMRHVGARSFRLYCKRAIANAKEDAMVDLVLKAEPIRSAPRQVKEWIRSVVLTELTLATGPERRQAETAEAS